MEHTNVEESWWVMVGAIWLFGFFLSGAVGMAIGGFKNRSGAGFWLGAFIGPVGWIIAALLPEDGQRCPECRGVVSPGARRCKHCGVVLEADHPLIPASQSSQGFYVLREGEAEGPFSQEQLRILVRSGSLRGNDLCAQDGSQEWMAVGRFL